MKRDYISIIVPVYKEEKVIESFYAELKNVLKKIDFDHELIFINDDHPDSETLSILKRLSGFDDTLKIISFTRNFGHQMALSAGLDYATGSAVLMLDADLQHPPSLIPKMIDYWKKGYDIVYTVRDDSMGVSLFNKIASPIFYKIINKISDTDIGFNCSDFRLMSRKVVDNFKRLKENARFIRGMVGWMGHKKIAVKFVCNKREMGRSKYSFKRKLRFALDGILSFSNFPIRIISLLGLVVSFMSFLYIIRIFIYIFFSHEPIPHYLPAITTMLFLSGIQMLMLGVLGEYIAKIFSETKNRPLYLIDEIYENKK
jgi:dolichol-phosphate mannosyltransferase